MKIVVVGRKLRDFANFKQIAHVRSQKIHWNKLTAIMKCHYPSALVTCELKLRNVYAEMQTCKP